MSSWINKQVISHSWKYLSLPGINANVMSVTKAKYEITRRALSRDGAGYMSSSLLLAISMNRRKTCRILGVLKILMMLNISRQFVILNAFLGKFSFKFNFYDISLAKWLQFLYNKSYLFPTMINGGIPMYTFYKGSKTVACNW